MKSKGKNVVKEWHYEEGTVDIWLRSKEKYTDSEGKSRYRIIIGPKFFIIDIKNYEKVKYYTCSLTRNKNNGNFYVKIPICSEHPEFLHRFLLGTIDSKMVVNHINGNGLDNREANLSIVTNQVNVSLQTLVTGKGTHFLGVSFAKGGNRFARYAASVVINGKYIFNKYFTSEFEAAHARDNAIIENGLEDRYSLNFLSTGEINPMLRKRNSKGEIVPLAACDME